MGLILESSLIDPAALNQRARRLVHRLSNEFACENHKTSITTSVYNTAWVSMIRKTLNGISRWLFPETFDFILSRQLPDGGWQSFPLLAGEKSSGADGIVNTMAALLALISRRNIDCDCAQEFSARIAKATNALQRMLQSWDVRSTDMVAFEVIVPAHLEMLEKHGLNFRFKGRTTLMKSYHQRMAKFRPESLYGNRPTSLLYCLEALIGKVDMNRLTHGKVAGSMLTSPSSTAAYLMNTISWDEEAEAYLRNAIVDGGFPDPYPSNIFEITWTLKALMEAFPRDVLVSPEASQVVDFLEKVFHAQGGLVGWTPDVLDEADDTSSVIYVLNYFARPTSPDAMIHRYESSDKFRCFAAERTPSPSANAHVLKGLLSVEEPCLYMDQVVKATSYICDCWWRGDASDKWSMTSHYGMMLFAQSLIMLLRKWDQGALENFPQNLLQDKVRLVLFGILTETLQAQNDNGSWGPKQSRETTAYAIITLATLASFPLSNHINDHIMTAIGQGQRFLQGQIKDWAEPDPIWRGKAVYGLAILAEAYTISAMSIAVPTHKFGKVVFDLCEVAEPGLDRIEQISTLPYFLDMPHWLVRACTVEGYLYLPLFDRMRKEIFPRRDIKQHRQWNVLPFSAVVCSRSKGGFYAPRNNLEFMVYCALMYEIDHYMEAIISSFEGVELDDIRHIVMQIFDESCRDLSLELCKDPYDLTEAEGASLRIQNLAGVKATLQAMTSYTLNHPKVASASKYDQSVLHNELKNYFLAQITSNFESSSLALRLGASSSSGTSESTSPQIQQTYHEWVHTTSASHVGALVTFAFLACLNNCNDDGEDCFASAEAKFYAQDLSLHVASYSRMVNDIGSLERDRQEMNLNSVDFPEFGTESGNDDLDERRRQLKNLAEYEREAYGRAFERLQGLGTEERVMKGIRAFCNVTELYAEIYAMEDISPRLAR